MKQSTISHSGVITEIKENTVKVSILSQSACSSCHAKGVCNISEMKEKIVEVDVSDLTKYKIGMQVNVLMSPENGGLAILLGYGIPFMLLFTSLIVMIQISHNEILSGIISLVVTGIYFLILSLFRKNLKKKFQFSIE